MIFSADPAACAELCSRVVNLAIETREALGLEGVAEPEEILTWQPMVEQLRKKADSDHLERWGLNALQAFCRIWDSRMTLSARKPEVAAFSSFEIATMLNNLSLYTWWLHENFQIRWQRQSGS